jgi:hypothetical protein
MDGLQGVYRVFEGSVDGTVVGNSGLYRQYIKDCCQMEKYEIAKQKKTEVKLF